MPEKYKKKQIVIEAVQWHGDNVEEIKAFAGDDALFTNRKLFIDSLEGILEAPSGWYIVKGVKGEFYPVEEQAFKETYEKVE